jgi:hypothetical protein
MNNPRLKDIAITAKDILIVRARALESGDRTINAESQNTGILTMYPTMDMARGRFFLPTIFRAPVASLNAPPDFSRNLPMIEPARITIPI